MSITTMICVIVGFLVAGVLGLVFITQWAEVQKARKSSFFDFFKPPRYDEEDYDE